METAGDAPILIDAFSAFTIGIVVYFLGERLTSRVSFLRAYSIPEPVSGGLFAALVVLAVVLFTGREVTFDLTVRDALLVFFFTTIGLNARLSDLVAGGPVLVLLLVVTVGYMVVQTVVGVLGAAVWGLPPQVGVLMGTASLVGGHGTSIAWGPVIAERFGYAGAAELGIASATMGLILASVLGGPIATHLIARHKLAPAPTDGEQPPAEGAQTEVATAADPVTNQGLLRSIFWLNVAIILGISAQEGLEELGVMLPSFVPCLLVGVLLSNTLPRVFPRITWPAGSPAMALVAEFCLSVFLAMSLMSMSLWTLAESVGVLATTMALQAVVATIFIIVVVFRVMGRDYFAVVLSAGFAGFALGATPTAIANMTAVTQRYGPAPLAFVVLPLVAAFFVDLVNSVLIQTTISLGS